LANKNAEKMPDFSIVNICDVECSKILIILNIFLTPKIKMLTFSCQKMPKNACVLN
jgi:hypothetical protein